MSKGPNPGFGRMLVKNTIWTHDGQKTRLVIFGRGAPKTGKKSWRETFGTTGVKFRSEMLSPGENLSSVLLRCDHGFQNFELERLCTFTLMVPKVSLQDFLPILAALLPKITNRSFWPVCDQNVGSELLRCDQIGQISKFFTWTIFYVSLQDFLPILAALWPKITILYFRCKNGYKIIARNFSYHWCKVLKCRDGTLYPKCQGGTLQPKLQSATPGTSHQMGQNKIENFDQERVFRFGTLHHQWCVKFLPSIFYPFWAPHGRKLWIGLFDRRATKTWVLSFWRATMGQIFRILIWRDFGPLHQWSRKFPSRIFYPFWAPHDRKLRICLFDRRATKWCFWPAATKTRVWSFWVTTMGQNFKMLTLRDSGQWSLQFSFSIFYPFWAPHGEKLRISLFDHWAIKWCFWPPCDQNLGSILLTVVRLFPYLSTFDQWCD